MPVTMERSTVADWYKYIQSAKPEEVIQPDPGDVSELMLIHNTSHDWQVEEASDPNHFPFEHTEREFFVQLNLDDWIVDELQQTMELRWYRLLRNRWMHQRHTVTLPQLVTTSYVVCDTRASRDSWETADWPTPLQKLRDTIIESRSLLEWGDDWDGESSLGYTEETWLRAANLLTDLAIPAFQAFNMALPVPAVLAGPRGSIDLHWKLPHKELLINVARGEDGKIRYYGDNRSGSFALEGHLDPSMSNFWMVLWLVQQP